VRLLFLAPLRRGEGGEKVYGTLEYLQDVRAKDLPAPAWIFDL
jgi:hypothetical protein